MSRPNPDRAAWLLHDTSHVCRLTIQTSQYVELQEEARALKAELEIARRGFKQVIDKTQECRSEFSALMFELEKLRQDLTST